MSMTLEKAIRMLEAKSKCMKREVSGSGTDFDCNFRNCCKCDLNYEQGTIGDQIEALSVAISALQEQDLQQSCNQLATDTINRQAAVDVLMEILDRPNHADFLYTDEICKALERLPSAQPDAVTTSLEELINDYGEDGFFIVDGVNYRANELLNELKTNSSVGEKFRKQITKTIVQYFMKFGG